MNFQWNMRNDSAIKFKGTRYSYLGIYWEFTVVDKKNGVVGV